jgi:hypothetical protein
MARKKTHLKDIVRMIRSSSLPNEEAARLILQPILTATAWDGYVDGRKWYAKFRAAWQARHQASA